MQKFVRRSAEGLDDITAVTVTAQPQEKISMRTTMKRNERFEKISRAFDHAGNVLVLDYATITAANFSDVLAIIVAALPDVNTQEIIDALRWSAADATRDALWKKPTTEKGRAAEY